MDIFEELFTSLNENIDIFKKYSMKKENGITIPADKEEDFDIEGKNILPSEKVKEFLQVRSIYYWNIVNKKLKDYSLPEWLACLEESVLLEYAIPIFSRVIQEYPMLWGLNGEWQVLYTITRVEKKFWLTHKDWKEFFVKIIYDYFSSNSEEDLITLFSEEYFYQFRDFVTDSR